MTSSFVIVDDLHLVRVSIAPSEADSPLIVDPDAMLTRPIAPQRFQPVAGRYAQEVQRCRGIHLNQFPQCDPQQIWRQSSRRHAAEKFFGFSVGKALNHRLAIAVTVGNSTFQN
jgi:hypothetical protein